MNQKVMVVGASRGIGREIALLHLRKGGRVALLGRNTSDLKSIPESKEEESRSTILACDVRKFSEIPAIFEKVVSELGGLDKIYYCSGSLEPQKPNEYNTSKDITMLETNLVGAVAFLNLASDYFQNQKSGSIIGISSVAGERGRQGNPVYNASKAGLNVYLEALRFRLASHNVKVYTMKPGYVKTDMLKGLKLKDSGFLAPISASYAAELINDAVEEGRESAFIPSKWSLVALILRWLPNFVFKKLSI
jgi:short-subunit dehydrogenase